MRPFALLLLLLAFTAAASCGGSSFTADGAGARGGGAGESGSSAAGSAGEAGMGGTGGDAGSPSDGCTPSRGCGANQWCSFPDHPQCGTTSGAGVCEARPGNCTEDCPGVCGCNGQFYCNGCLAEAAGTDISSDTLCGLYPSCTSDDQCTNGQKCCYPCGIPGCTNRCLTPVNGQCPAFL